MITAEAQPPRSSRGPADETPDPGLVQRLFILLWCVGFLFQALLSVLPIVLPLTNSSFIPGLHMDKLLHALAFLILGSLTPLAYRKGVALAMGGALLGLLALGTEYGQQLVPWRTFSFADMIADFVGLAPGLWLGRRASNRLYAMLELARQNASLVQGE